MRYKVQFKGARSDAKWATAAVCATEDHAAFVASGLSENRSLAVRVVKVKGKA